MKCKKQSRNSCTPLNTDTTSNAPLFLKPLKGKKKFKSSTPSFIQIHQEIRKVWIRILLGPQAKYDYHWGDFHGTQDCSTTHGKEIMYRVLYQHNFYTTKHNYTSVPQIQLQTSVHCHTPLSNKLGIAMELFRRRSPAAEYFYWNKLSEKVKNMTHSLTIGFKQFLHFKT